jgi:hypothetical protein
MIRFVVGLLIVFGAVGGIENAPADSTLLGEIAIAMVGLSLMWWTVTKPNAFN